MRSVIALLVLLGVAGCGSIATDPVRTDGGDTVKPVVPAKSLVLSESLSISAETLALAVAAYMVVDPLSPNWRIEEARIGKDRFRISLRKKRFTTGGDGEAAQVFYRHAEQIVRENGYAGYSVIEFGEGVESTVPIARRVSEGIIQVR